ncbi:MAG: porin family protein [Salegentibacter sp.]
MKYRSLLILLVLFSFSNLFSQVEEEGRLNSVPDTIPSVIDSLYREDQFYVGFSFNLLTNKPSVVSQSGFSGGLHLGVIRDFPLNKQRNIAIGAGVGWSINSYGQNLFIGEDTQGGSIFRSLKGVDYNSNRFTTQLVEVPLQFRWRTSSPLTYKFWRVYTGLRLGYIYYFRSHFYQTGNRVVQTKVPELDRFRLGTTFTFGYNTFNFQFYYSLNPLFSSGKVEGEDIGLSALKIGLMFYIL